MRSSRICWNRTRRVPRSACRTVPAETRPVVSAAFCRLRAAGSAGCRRAARLLRRPGLPAPAAAWRAPGPAARRGCGARSWSATPWWRAESTSVAERVRTTAGCRRTRRPYQPPTTTTPPPPPPVTAVDDSMLWWWWWWYALNYQLHDCHLRQPQIALSWRRLSHRHTQNFWLERGQLGARPVKANTLP